MSNPFSHNNGFPRSFQMQLLPNRQAGVGIIPGPPPYQPTEFYPNPGLPFLPKEGPKFDMGMQRPINMLQAPPMSSGFGLPGPICGDPFESRDDAKKQVLNTKRKNNTPPAAGEGEKVEKKLKTEQNLDAFAKKNNKMKIHEETPVSKTLKTMIAEVKEITRPMESFWPQTDIPDNFMLRYSLSYLNSKLDLIRKEKKVLLTEDEIEIKKNKMMGNISGEPFDPVFVYGETMETEYPTKSFKHVNEARQEKKNQKLERLEEESATINRKLNDHKRQIRKLDNSYMVRLAEKERAEKILDMVVRI